MINLKVLFTGVGRSGTTYSAIWLTQMGIPCGHEAIFTELGIEEAQKRLLNPSLISFSQCSENISLWTDPWSIEADSSYLAAPFVNHPFLKNTKIIRLIRNPLEVISSYVFDAKYFDDNNINEITKPFQEYIKSHLPIVYDNNLSPINRAALFYIEWHNLIKQNPNVFDYKIESKPDLLLDHLMLPKNQQATIDKKINSWNHNSRPTLSYDDIAEPYKSNLIEEYQYSRKIFI
jgi:hypothetical protein